MAMAMEVDEVVPRLEGAYARQDERFELVNQRYRGQQYSHLYYVRLLRFRQILDPIARSRWPALPVTTILGLEEGKRCIVIGTIYKQMKLKPSILDEYAKERSKVPLAAPHNFMHPDDYIVLEDESGRVKLTGSRIIPSTYVTGIVIAVCGEEGKDGDFFVHEVLQPGLPPQKPVPPVAEDKYVAFVSGLRIGSGSCDQLQLQLLVDHLTGHLGEQQDQRMSSRVVRLILAGDSVNLQYSSLASQSISARDQAKVTEPVRELDLVLTQLVAAMPVDIMPGANDPANFTLPQQALHRCLFPGATSYSNTFVRATNPHEFELDGVEFLGTSGQNIDDLGKYSEANDVLEFMGRTLLWRHLAPTAPDTLGCYPFTDRDPFVVEKCPRVYFCGNQKAFMSRLITEKAGGSGQTTRLISIPRFCETGTAVLVLHNPTVFIDRSLLVLLQMNVKNLDVHLLTLSTNSL